MMVVAVVMTVVSVVMGQPAFLVMSMALARSSFMLMPLFRLAIMVMPMGLIMDVALVLSQFVINRCRFPFRPPAPSRRFRAGLSFFFNFPRLHHYGHPFKKIGLVAWRDGHQST